MTFILVFVVEHCEPSKLLVARKQRKFSIAADDHNCSTVKDKIVLNLNLRTLIAVLRGYLHLPNGEIYVCQVQEGSQQLFMSHYLQTVSAIGYPGVRWQLCVLQELQAGAGGL